MKSKSKKLPTPEELLVEIQGQAAAKTYEFADYLPAIHAMQQKGYSYAEIAEFLKKRLGFTASRGQVYRAYQGWLEDAQDAQEGMDEEDESVPESTVEDEIHEKLHQNALDLIESMQPQNEVNAPWDEPHSILRKAVQILDEKQALEKRAEDAAAEADKLIEAQKAKNNAPVGNAAKSRQKGPGGKK